MATNLVAKFTKLADPTLIRNKLQDRNSDFRELNGNDSSTLCRNFVRFGLVIPDFTTLECAAAAADHYWG